MHTVSNWRRFAVLGALGGAALLHALLSGSADVAPADLLRAALGRGDALAQTVLLDLRLPRALTAFAVGALLAVAGVLLQALFRNPLADPYVLGVSGGAAVSALLAMALGAGMVLTQTAAAAGALAAVALVWSLGGRGGATQLLLTGVVVAATCGALVTLILALSDAEALRGMIFWLAGDLSWAGHPALALSVAAAASVAAALLARPLDVLAAGELRSQSVGLDLRVARGWVIAGAALLAAAAVISAGTIGFVGLLAPHAARLLLRTSRHRVVVPAAALLGGILVTVADTVARTVIEPRQLPVGALLALLGAPAFLSLLRRAR